ncbi:MAG: hypothetical protein KJN69_09830 [Gammaproteobacteria bacterium]|nr:hypothetical protein [Gammaproteobacteria bacterium]
MNETTNTVIQEHLPFFITAPGETDLLFTAVNISLVLVLIGFGALYFTIQAIPDRLAEGSSKTQMQIVGILGLVSLFTMNNALWVAGLLLAAVRIPDFVTPFKSIARSLKKLSMQSQPQVHEILAIEAEVPDPAPIVEETGTAQERDND